MVFVDGLSNMTRLVTFDLRVDAPHFANIFIQHIWRLHRTLPKEIVSDRDPVSQVPSFRVWQA